MLLRTKFFARYAVKNMSAQDIVISQSGMVEIILGVAAHTDFFYHPNGWRFRAGRE